LESTKDYIHISDVAELLPRIAATGRERLYNVASGMQISHAQWAKRLSELTGCVVEVSAAAPAVRFVPIDINRIQQEFGYEPRPVLSVLDHATAASN
jgi:nucleoside-diphosphate-sugar epimerase